MQTWKTLSRQTILDRGKFLVVESHTVVLPNGRVIDDWPWIITPDYVNVVAVTAEKTFLCFRQVKYAVEGEFLALVGGYLEPDENPLAAAQRELAEETGYKASTWHDLGAFSVDGNRGAGRAYLFLALDARHAAEPVSDDFEEQHLVQLSLAEVEAALKSGRFKLLSNVSSVALALDHIEKTRFG